MSVCERGGEIEIEIERPILKDWGGEIERLREGEIEILRESSKDREREIFYSDSRRSDGQAAMLTRSGW